MSETLAEEAAKVYKLYEVDLDPKWFPVFYMLKSGSCLPITVIAEAIGHSHASVSKIAKEMTAAGILKSEKLADDARVNQVCLTDKGRTVTLGETVKVAYVEQSRDSLNDDHNVWEAISGGQDILRIGISSLE